jgi:hypothetical protein
LPSDQRVHENASVVGFDVTTGSAPDYVSISTTSGTFRQNDILMTLNVMGSLFPTCYRLDVTTDKGLFYNCTTDGSGSCIISHTSGGQFSDGTNVLVKVSKTCNSSQVESVAYDVVGHF